MSGLYAASPCLGTTGAAWAPHSSLNGAQAKLMMPKPGHPDRQVSLVWPLSIRPCCHFLEDNVKVSLGQMLQSELEPGTGKKLKLDFLQKDFV
jgi:hypothetical protein